MLLTLIKLDARERASAEDYSRTVLSRVRGDSYTDLELPDRYFVGRLGELAVRKWAEREDLLYHETVQDDGHSDEQDFLFHFKDGRLARVNVKNSLHPRAKYLMQPAAQADAHVQDLYIGASGEDNGDSVVIRLWGAITREQFLERAQRVQRKIPTLQFPLASLPYAMEHLAFRILKTPRRH